MGHMFWLSDEQWAVIEPLLPRNNKGGTRRVDDRRVIFRHHSCPQSGEPLVWLTEGMRTVDDDLQPLKSLVLQALLDRSGRGACRLGRGDQEHVHGQRLRQGASLRP